MTHPIAPAESERSLPVVRNSNSARTPGGVVKARKISVAALALTTGGPSHLNTRCNVSDRT